MGAITAAVIAGTSALASAAAGAASAVATGAAGAAGFGLGLAEGFIGAGGLGTLLTGASIFQGVKSLTGKPPEQPQMPQMAPIAPTQNTPSTPTAEALEAEALAEGRRTALARSRARTKTILTPTTGVAGQELTRKTLLGE